MFSSLLSFSPPPKSDLQTLKAAVEETQDAATSVDPYSIEAVFEFVDSERCKSYVDIDAKYAAADEIIRVKARRIFYVLKDQDPQNPFVIGKARHGWSDRQMRILAFAQYDDPMYLIGDTPQASIDGVITLAQTALDALKRSHASALFSPVTGSSGSINLQAKDSTIFTFIQSDQCTGWPSIRDNNNLALVDDKERASRMFYVCKDMSPGNIFIPLRAGWSEEQMFDVAVEHANLETRFTTAEQVAQFLSAIKTSKFSARKSAVSNYLTPS